MAGMSGQVAAGCSDARAASTVQQGDRQIAEGCHNLGVSPVRRREQSSPKVTSRT